MDQQGDHAPLVEHRAPLGDGRGGGHYTEIEPLTRLAFTWIWDDETRRTLIEIDFEERDGETTLRFAHRDLWDEEAVRGHEDGWGKVLAKP